MLRDAGRTGQKRSCRPRVGRWPAHTEVDTRWRGSFGYFTALVGPEEEQERIPLCRTEHLGGDRWVFALYDPASDSYTPQLLHTGSWEGSPDYAFDTATLVHLADYES